jgi:hypothetical protein
MCQVEVEQTKDADLLPVASSLVKHPTRGVTSWPHARPAAQRQSSGFTLPMLEVWRFGGSDQWVACCVRRGKQSGVVNGPVCLFQAAAGGAGGFWQPSCLCVGPQCSMLSQARKTMGQPGSVPDASAGGADPGSWELCCISQAPSSHHNFQCPQFISLGLAGDSMC